MPDFVFKIPQYARFITVVIDADGTASMVASSASPQVKDRSVDRHRPGYYADYQRKRRAALKEKPNG